MARGSKLRRRQTDELVHSSGIGLRHLAAVRCDAVIAPPLVIQMRVGTGPERPWGSAATAQPQGRKLTDCPNAVSGASCRDRRANLCASGRGRDVLPPVSYSEGW